MIFRGFRFKLVPSQEQEVTFRQTAGVCRLIYNLAWEQRRIWGREHRLGFVSQSRELTEMRAQYDWVAAVPQSCQEQALRDLDKAFVNFFTGRAKFPTPRRKDVDDSFCFRGREIKVRRINAKWSAVRLPKIGWVKFRDTRPMRGDIRTVTISPGPIGWHVSFGCAIEHEAPANICPAVGIDRGIANTIMLSTGEALSVPLSLEAIDRRHRVAQHILARRKKGSNRRRRQLRRIAKLSARRARIRSDWHHRAGRSIADRFGTVVMEELKIRNMTASARGTIEEPGSKVAQKSGLNRSILNQGWGSFATILGYKLEERGGTLVLVDPKYTSQSCSDCGTVDRESRESQAVFACRHCGFRAHADQNAAINILRRNTASMRMEDRHWPTDEVRTGGDHFAENLIASAARGC